MWRRAEERGDFPTLQRTFNAIEATMQNDLASLPQLAAMVLSDFTLTQRILKLANSAMYAPYGRDVTTVSRALKILGVATVAHLSTGIQLLKTFESVESASSEAARELASVAFSGKLAREIAIISGAKSGEEAAVATLMHEVGRLLVIFYLPAHWQEIRQLMDNGHSEADAFKSTLGMSKEELTAEAMRKWAMPAAMLPLTLSTDSDVSQLVKSHGEWLGAVATLSNRLAQALSRGEPESIDDAISEFAPRLGLDCDEIRNTALAAFEFEDKPEEVVVMETSSDIERGERPADSQSRLAQAIAEVGASVADADVSGATSLVLESMMRALGMSICVAFVRNSEGIFEAKVGFGSNVLEKLNSMRFHEAFVPDVAHLTLSNGRAIYIEDINAPIISARIPVWHKEVFPNVCSAVFLPIRVKTRSLGLLYGNWGTRHCSAGISTAEMDALCLLRDAIVSAHEAALRYPSHGLSAAGAL